MKPFVLTIFVTLGNCVGKAGVPTEKNHARGICKIIQIYQRDIFIQLFNTLFQFPFASLYLEKWSALTASLYWPGFPLQIPQCISIELSERISFIISQFNLALVCLKVDNA